MKKRHGDKTKTPSINPTNNFFTRINEKPSDFWWNFVYFLILTTAITFILVNNSSHTLQSAAALTILGLLLCLDIFPALYLMKVLIRYSSLKRNRR